MCGCVEKTTSSEFDDLFVQGERVSTVASIEREVFLLESEDNWRWNSRKYRKTQEHQRNTEYVSVFTWS